MRNPIEILAETTKVLEQDPRQFLVETVEKLKKLQKEFTAANKAKWEDKIK